MALDFPAEPEDGEVYEGFFWDATLQVWKKTTAPAFLDSISDVNITNPADNEVLVYDNDSGNWINQTASEAGIAEASHTHTASEITDIATYVSDNSSPRLLIETTTRTANYTLALTDINSVVPMNGSNLIVTVPTNASVAFPIGSVVNVYNLDSTTVNIVGDSGVTVRNAGALAQYTDVALRKRGTDEWVLAGNVS
jgi:hypothetical protein